MDLVAVYPDGHADLALAGDDQPEYYFRSPSHSARPASLPANVEVEVRCYVTVTVYPDHVEARIRSLDPIDARCAWPLRPLPRCSPARTWAKALAHGAARDTIAKVELLSDGQWFFDNTDENNHGLVESFADDCR